jgi:hypothetical protein
VHPKPLHALTLLLVCFAGLTLPRPCSGQTVITLSSEIGPANTNAASVAGVGQIVNFTGVAANSGATILIATGSSGSAAFDFSTGFTDGFDRSVGSTAGAGNVFVDRKYDSSGTALLLLDTNNNGSFTDESALTGFGMHSDTFITFDLSVLRSTFDLASDTPFLLTGAAGVADRFDSGQTSAAIIADNTQLAVFDWRSSGPYNQYSTFSVSVSGSTQYLTFAGLSGLDGSNWADHVGFANVQLTVMAIPEPATCGLFGLGLAFIGLATARRQKADPKRNADLR